MRDSTWPAITHLTGNTASINLASTVCYYEMMARRLNGTSALDIGLLMACGKQVLVGSNAQISLYLCSQFKRR